MRRLVLPLLLLWSPVYADYRDVQIVGAHQLDASTVNALVDRYMQGGMTTLDLQQLRLALSELYADAGFVTSGVIVDSIDGDVATLRAIEGALPDITIAQDTRLNQRYIATRLERFLQAPLKVEDVQYALRWLQQDPNVDRLDAELLPGEAPGDSVLSVSVDEPQRVALTLGGNNHRSASLGSEAATIVLDARNLTGFGETTTLTGVFSDGTDEYSAAFAVPLNRWNTRLGAYYGESDARIVEARFDDLDIESETRTAGLFVEHPIIDDLNQDLTLRLGLENKRSDETLFGIPFSFSPGAEDGVSETTAIEFGADFSWQNEKHYYALSATYRYGIDALGASEFSPRNPFEAQLNPTGADGDFEKVVVQGVALRRLNTVKGFDKLHDRAQLLAKLTTQFTEDPLMSLEKLSIGGVNTVRGFRENTFVRDKGVAASVELQLPVPGYRAEAHPLNLVVSLFVDYGRSWDTVNTSPSQQTQDTTRKRYIASAGLGLLWQPLEGLRTQIYWGEPIADNFDGDDPSKNATLDYDLQDEGLHFALTYTPTW